LITACARVLSGRHDRPTRPERLQPLRDVVYFPPLCFTDARACCRSPLLGTANMQPHHRDENFAVSTEDFSTACDALNEAIAEAERLARTTFPRTAASVLVELNGVAVLSYSHQRPSRRAKTTYQYGFYISIHGAAPTPLLEAPVHIRVAAACAIPALFDALRSSSRLSAQDVQRATTDLTGWLATRREPRL
jgi:hypothetical protein